MGKKEIYSEAFGLNTTTSPCAATTTSVAVCWTPFFSYSRNCSFPSTSTLVLMLNNNHSHQTRARTQPPENVRKNRRWIGWERWSCARWSLFRTRWLDESRQFWQIKQTVAFLERFRGGDGEIRRPFSLSAQRPNIWDSAHGTHQNHLIHASETKLSFWSRREGLVMNIFYSRRTLIQRNDKNDIFLEDGFWVEI